MNDEETVLIVYQPDKMKAEDFWKQINLLESSAPSWLRIAPISCEIEHIDLINKNQGIVKLAG